MMDIKALRQEIDSIDSAIHDLLMRRVAVAEQVGKLKDRDPARRHVATMRPAREAEILRRLLDRHRGSLPKTTILRIWREIFAAVVRLQGDLSIACYFPVQDTQLRRAFRDLARDHFGHDTPLDLHERPVQVINAIMQDDAVVGILPLPDLDDPAPWWSLLRFVGPTGPRIVARLPFARGLEGPQALAVGRFAYEPSGDDRSFIAVQLAENLSTGRIQESLTDAGLKVRALSRWRDPVTQDTWAMAETKGYVDINDARLQQIADLPSKEFRGAICLGGYAVPPRLIEQE